MRHDPSIGVTVFIDYVNMSGSGRMALIGQQMGRILDPNRPAWFPYAAAEAKIKAAVASPDRAAVLRSMVESAPERMRPHYQEIAVGCDRWLASNRLTLLPVRSASWAAHGLTVKVLHHIGLRLPDGSAVAALLYLKQPPLIQAGANVGLRIMEQLMGSILPGAASMVLDVRRGKPFKLNGNVRRHRLDAWLQSEAAGYVTHWRTA